MNYQKLKFDTCNSKYYWSENTSPVYGRCFVTTRLLLKLHSGRKAIMQGF